MSGAYYNDTNPYVAEWLRILIAAGLIPAGDVDERSIKEVQPDDVRSYTQCHFFAGFGGWALAARLAGWPDDRPLWTGSCPCQPFSVAGKGGAFNDSRHLWPDFYRVISAVRPLVVMGEQVAQKAGYGWFDGVAADLESQSYACRAVDIPSCAVNAPHRRNRIYWVADTACFPERKPQYQERSESRSDARVNTGGSSSEFNGMDDANRIYWVAHPQSERCGEAGARIERPAKWVTGLGANDNGLDDATSTRFEQGGCEPLAPVWNEARGQQLERRSGDDSGTLVDGLAHPNDALGGPNESGRYHEYGEAPGRIESDSYLTKCGAWDDWTLIGPDDKGRYRRIKSGIACVAPRRPATSAILSALGNGLTIPLAAEVIRAYMEARP